MVNSKTSPHLRETFFRLKPLCDSAMVKPTAENIAQFVAAVPTLQPQYLQEVHQYILFPFLAHVKEKVNEGKYEIPVINAMKTVMEKIHIEKLDVVVKLETGLISLVFDKAIDGILEKVPEEMRLAVMRSLTALMLSVVPDIKYLMLKKHLPVLAQAVFVSVHIAKLDRMKTLRLAALECVQAYTMCHPNYCNGSMQLKYKALEEPVVDYLSTILPGTVAALQDVALAPNNPGHVVIVAAIETIHRILCITIHNKRLKDKKQDISVQDFTSMIANSNVPKQEQKDMSCKMTKLRSPEWFELADAKLVFVTRALTLLISHDNHLVRRELAVMYARIVDECCDTLPSSVPLALDVLLSLSKDDYKEVSHYCTKRVHKFFNKASPERRLAAMDGLCENFFTTLNNLPRILNNIDSGRKLSALNLMRGYVEMLSDRSRPQRLTVALSAAPRCDELCDALAAAAALRYEHTALTKQAVKELDTTHVTQCPWLQLRHLDSPECLIAFENIIFLLAGAECSELLLDRILELFHQRRDCELVYIMNRLGSTTRGPPRLAKRIINTYIEDDIWYLPLDIGTKERPLTKDETLDPDVYNPRAWTKDSVPGLYEGATEVRYTDISYQYDTIFLLPPSDTCRTIAESQRNLAMCCLLTEGVGMMARRLKEDFQPFMLKTLCLILERVGSKFEILHKSGKKALTDIAHACSLSGPKELIAQNADYFTSQVSIKLKKAWDVQSALQILTVVMTNSDTRILEYMYAIVEEILVQSCDKYYQKDLFAYLQVFECFVYCIHRWFPMNIKEDTYDDKCMDDCIDELIEFIKNHQKLEKLLREQEQEESAKSAEEMYREDMEKKIQEEEELDYEDAVTHLPPPLPRYASVTVTILKRALNFIGVKGRDESILAMHIFVLGLPILNGFDDEVLPLVHQCWEPLLAKFRTGQPPIMKKAFEVLVMIGHVSKDFMRARASKDVFPLLLKFLLTASLESRLKDAGATYRHTQAYSLQTALLSQLHCLIIHLSLDDRTLAQVMVAVDPYMSNKQPKQLQSLAVHFYRMMLTYNYGLTWYHLRKLCGNSEILKPPRNHPELVPVVGTVDFALNKDINENIQQIFGCPHHNKNLVNAQNSLTFKWTNKA